MTRLRTVGVLAMLAGCSVGHGDGFVTGLVDLNNCRQGEPLTSADPFDLGADFFAGDPLLDTNPVASLRRSTLIVRIQNTSTRVEEADSLMLNIEDVAGVARSFARQELIAVQDDTTCPDEDCGPQPVLLRSTLNLFNTCPSSHVPLIASSRVFSRQEQSAVPAQITTDACYRPTAQQSAPCPDLTAQDRQKLNALCLGNFNDARLSSQIAAVLGKKETDTADVQNGRSCVYFCEYGEAKAGQSPEALKDFQLNFGDMIAVIFSLTFIDGKSTQLDVCAQGRAQIQGMAKFRFKRSRAAQTFP